MAIGLFAFVFSLAQVVPAPQQEDALGYRDALLRQLDALHSIECTYLFCCGTRADNRPDRVEFRWKDGWLWYASHPQGGPPEHEWAHSLLMEASVDGICSSYWVDENTGKSYHHYNYKGMRFMAHNELSPRTLLGVSSPFSYVSFTDGLKAFLTDAKAPILEQGENGDKRLYLYPEPEDGDYEGLSSLRGMILTFDDELRIVRIEYVLRPKGSLAEIAAFAPDRPPHHIYRRFVEDVFEDYMDMDGVPLPAKLRRAILNANPTEHNIAIQQHYNDRFASGQLSECEELVRMMVEIDGYVEKTVYTAEIDPATVRINNPALSKADFQIAPDKADVTWDITSGDVVDESGAYNVNALRKEAEEHRDARLRASLNQDNSLTISALVALGSIALLVTAWLLKRQSAAHGGRKPK
jgi:hypothetical protein